MKTVAAVIVLAYAVQAPWFNAIARLFPPILFDVPASALINVFWIATLSMVLLPPLLRSYRLRRPVWPEYLVMMWPLLHILNLRAIDAPAGVALENSFFISLLMLTLLRKEDKSLRFPGIGVSYLGLFTLSYVLALTLPWVIRIEGRPLYGDYGLVDRYVGWSGAGGIGFSGAALATCGLLGIYRALFSSSAALPAAAVFAGLAGIQMSVQRIALLAVASMLLAAAVLGRRAVPKERTRLVFLLFLLAVTSFWIPSMMKKMESPSGLLKQQTWTEGNLNRVSNGRYQLTSTMLKGVEKNGWRGSGSGGAVRHLKSIHYATRDPHNDYLKTFFDHGLAGLFLLLTIGGALWFSLQGRIERVAVIGLGVMMVTDNLLVYPAFAYGPMLLGTFLIGRSSPGRHGWAIVQRTLPFYRFPFFDRLHARHPIAVFFGAPGRGDKVVETERRAPWQRRIAAFRWLGFTIQPSLLFRLFRENPSAIVCEMNLRMLMNYPLLALARMNNTDFYWWTSTWGPPSQSAWFSFFRPALLKFLARRATGVLVYGNWARDRVAAWGVDKSRVFVCSNSVDMEALESAIHRWNERETELQTFRRSLAEDKEPVILSLGTLQPDKRIDRLIAAFGEFAERRGSKATLLIIGDGPERNRLEQLASVRQGRVRFLGHVSAPEDIARYGRISDLFVLPGVGGLSLLQAAVCGLPLMSCGAGDGTDRDIIESGLNGYLLDRDSSLAEAFTQFFALPPEERKRMGVASQSLAKERFGLERMVDGFQRALNGRLPGSAEQREVVRC